MLKSCVANTRRSLVDYVHRQGPVTVWRYTGYVMVKIALVSFAYHKSTLMSSKSNHMCVHLYVGCMYWSQLSVWCYVVGYLAQAALGLVSSGTKTFKRWSEYCTHLVYVVKLK